MPSTNILIAIFAGFALSQVAIFVTTAYLHRSLTHRSVVFVGPMQEVFKLTVWLTTGLSPREWVAVHREHHAHTDVEGDPHSPAEVGIFTVVFGMFYLFKKALYKDRGLVARNASDIKETWVDRNVYRGGGAGPVVGVIALWVVLVEWQGLTPGTMLAVAGTHAAFYLVYGGLINGLGHYERWGYKNYPEADGRNSFLLAVFVMFEGWHNNHHQRQRSARFSRRRDEGGRWYEFDLVWWSLLGLRKLRLATIPELDRAS